MRKGMLFLLLLISLAKISAQSITPFTVNIAGFTAIEELLSKLGDNEVSITPNPTNGVTNLITNFSVPGQMQYQILDISSKLMFRSQPVNGLSNKQSKIELSNYPAGVYYVLVFFKPNSGIAKTGIYKIIKL